MGHGPAPIKSDLHESNCCNMANLCPMIGLRRLVLVDGHTGSRSKSTAGDLVNDPVAGPVTAFGSHARL
jgi:hypothetical protein